MRVHRQTSSLSATFWNSTPKGLASLYIWHFLALAVVLVRSLAGQTNVQPISLWVRLENVK